MCEQALDLLLGTPELRGIALKVVDVADHPALLARYGERLPVLLAGGAALDWPFTARQVLAHLGAVPEQP